MPLETGHNYPANWDEITQYILQRDSHRCQVVGCPSLLKLHVHHKTAIGQGGTHEPNNLITLCEFHHALDAQPGHEQMRLEIKNDRFTFVRSFYRRNQYNYQNTQHVRQSLRRFKLISVDDVKKLASMYNFQCPSCGQQQINAILNYEERVIIIKCLNDKCYAGWIGLLQLAEETGPRIAELLVIKNCTTSLRVNWNALHSEAENFWEVYNFCPECGDTMHLVKPKENNTWPAFWSCDRYDKYSENSCHGTREIDGMPRNKH